MSASNAGQSVASMQAARCPPAEWPLTTSGRPSRASSRVAVAHLPDDLVDGDIGTKIVARNRDADAMGVQAARRDG